MEGIKKKMASLRAEADYADDRRTEAEEKLREANAKLEQVNLHFYLSLANRDNPVYIFKFYCYWYYNITHGYE